MSADNVQGEQRTVRMGTEPENVDNTHSHKRKAPNSSVDIGPTATKVSKRECEWTDDMIDRLLYNVIFFKTLNNVDGVLPGKLSAQEATQKLRELVKVPAVAARFALLRSQGEEKARSRLYVSKEDFVLFHNVIPRMLQNGFLSSKEVLKVGRSCRSMFEALKPLINSAISFRLTVGEKLSVYCPRKLSLAAVLPMWVNGVNASLDNLANLTSIRLCGPFNLPLINLPHTITHLTTGFLYNETADFLPPTLIEFTVGQSFNQPVNNLPPTLTHFTTGIRFDKPVDQLPPKLTHFTAGHRFNQPVNKLPNSITHLTFGNNFNQTINSLPHNLIYLEFRVGAGGGRKFWEHKGFNSPIDNLPPSLTSLTLSAWFNHPIENLPPKLKTLTMGTCFDLPIDKLPASLTHLQFPSNSQLRAPVDRLPPNLTHLTLGLKFQQRVDNLPKTLTHLQFGRFFSQPLDSLPPSLLHLRLENSFNYPLDMLPPGLLFLKIGKDQFSTFSHTLHKLPEALTHLLVLGSNYYHPFCNLPPNLIEITTSIEYRPRIPKYEGRQLNHIKIPYDHDIFGNWNAAKVQEALKRVTRTQQH